MKRNELNLIQGDNTLQISKTRQSNSVDLRVIKWAVNAVLNFAELTVVPYVTQGMPYYYFVAKFPNGCTEEDGTYVDEDTVKVIFNLLQGKWETTDYLATEHPVVKDETFVQKLLERMMNERKCFYKKPAVTKDGVTYFRGYYRFFRGVVKFNIPRNESIDKFLTEKGFINRKEFI
jgi:hypothetical protein